MSEEKNRKIRETLRATRERRSNMDCFVISVKIQENKLSKRRFSFGRKVQHGILGRVKDKFKKNASNVMLESSVPTTQTCPECGCLTKHSLDKRVYHCNHCGYENPDRDVHSARMMVLLSGYGTYRSLNTDAVSAERMAGLLDNLSELGVVVKTTDSM